MIWPTLVQMDLDTDVTVSWIQRGRRITISGTAVEGSAGRTIQWNEQRDKSLTYGLWVK